MATLLVFLCVVAVYGLSYYQRQASYTVWMANRDAYVVDHVTAMSTKDAYHWLKMARDMDAGKLGKGHIDPLKGYPDLDEYPRDPNLLVKLISIASKTTDGDYYHAGLLLVPLLAGLFVFPLFLYFNSLGFGATAILGGLIGSFSQAYYTRSYYGHVDTDILNTFFPMLVSAIIVLIGRDRHLRSNLLLATTAGAAMFLYIWWYQQPAIFLVYLFFIIAYLLLLPLPWKQIGWILLAFTLASGPLHILQSLTSLQVFLNAYFFPKPTGLVVWPDIMREIAEARKNDVVSTLKNLHGFLPVVLAGFAGLAYLYSTHFKRMLPITPLVLLGLWSLFGPGRFAMYMAPFIGIGVGVLIELLAKQLGAKLQLHRLVSTAIAISLMTVLFFSTIGYTAYHVIPAPTVTADTTKAFLEIKQIVPKHSAMFTSWSSGYPLMEIGEFATYHDGSLQGNSRTTLWGKAITSARQEEMVSLLSYLEDYGFDALDTKIVDENLTGDQMMQLIFSHPPHFRGENVFVLYTNDLIEKFGGISASGTWDFNKKNSDPMHYVYLKHLNMSNNILYCEDSRVDLNRGIVTDDRIVVHLKAALFINNGYVVSRIDFPTSTGNHYLQVVMKNGQWLEVQVIEERLFRTNFNQQYLLGNYDRRYFEEVYNDFPVARAFRVRNAAED